MFVVAFGFVFVLRIKEKHFQKGNIILHFHTKSMLMAVYKVKHQCVTKLFAEIVLNHLMSAV